MRWRSAGKPKATVYPSGLSLIALASASRDTAGAHYAFDAGNKHHAKVYNLALACRGRDQPLEHIGVGCVKIGDYVEALLAAARECRSGGMSELSPKCGLTEEQVTLAVLAIEEASAALYLAEETAPCTSNADSLNFVSYTIMQHLRQLSTLLYAPLLPQAQHQERNLRPHEQDIPPDLFT